MLGGDPAQPIVVVAAFAPELRALGRLRATDGPAPVRAVVGVGLVEAGIGAGQLIARVRPRAIILVGTAGVYPGAEGKLALGDVVVANQIVLASASVATGAAYLPEPLPATVAPTAELAAAIADAAHATQAKIACPLGITSAATTARRLAKATGAVLENLEAFAVARAAAQANLPFAAVLGIANHVGPEGHAEWKSHGTRAAAAACAAVRAWFAAR